MAGTSPLRAFVHCTGNSLPTPHPSVLKISLQGLPPDPSPTQEGCWPSPLLCHPAGPLAPTFENGAVEPAAQTGQDQRGHRDRWHQPPGMGHPAQTDGPAGDTCSRSATTHNLTAGVTGRTRASAFTHLDPPLIGGQGPVGHQPRAQHLLQEAAQLLRIVPRPGARGLDEDVERTFWRGQRESGGEGGWPRARTGLGQPQLWYP